jgi:hypothetical protein
MLGKNHHGLTRLTLFHFDVVDIHYFDVVTPHFAFSPLQHSKHQQILDAQMHLWIQMLLH